MRDKNKKGVLLSDFHCELSFESEYKEIYSEKVVKKLLNKSVNTAKSLGTSTCTILMLDKSNGKVYTAQVGDSTYMILRYDYVNGRYFKEFKSEEQMHSECFNTPFQVGKDGDNPDKAVTKTHQLRSNDIIITATDG